MSVKLVPSKLYYSPDDTIEVKLISDTITTYNVYVENNSGGSYNSDPPYPYPIGLSLSNNYTYYTWATNKLNTYYENVYNQVDMDSNIIYVFNNNDTYLFRITYTGSEDLTSNTFTYVDSYTITVTSSDNVTKLVYSDTDTISITSTLTSSSNYFIRNNDGSTTVEITSPYTLSTSTSGSYCITRDTEASNSFYVITSYTLTLSTTFVTPGTTITISSTDSSTFDTLYLYCNNTSSLIDKITYGSQSSQTYTAYNLINTYSYFFSTSNDLTDALISEPFTYDYEEGSLVLTTTVQDPSTISYGTIITIKNTDGSNVDQIGTLYIYDNNDNTVVDTIVTTTLTEYTYSIGNLLTNGVYYYYKNSSGVMSDPFEFTINISLNLTNNNDRTPYYYGDVISISSNTVFQELLLCISPTNPVSIFSTDETKLTCDGLDDDGVTVTNTFYNNNNTDDITDATISDSCYYKYTIPNTLIYNQTYFFATPNFDQISNSFTYSIKQDLNIKSNYTDTFNTFIYKIGDTINISSDTSIEELRLCTTVTTNTKFISTPSSNSHSYTTSWSDLNDLTNATGGYSITGTYFFATSNYEQISSPFKLHGILLEPYKTRYFDGESVTVRSFDDEYNYFIMGQTSTLITLTNNSYTFSGLTDDTEYYIYYTDDNETYTSHTFLYKDPPSSFYVIPTMDIFYNSDDAKGGQSYKIITSRFVNKSLIVPFGGNNVNKQQGTSEAHCYFVTSIINQYMLKYFTYKSMNTTSSDIDELLNLLIYSINFISEMVSINLEETSETDQDNVKTTMGNVFFPPWEFYIDEYTQLHGCNDGSGTVPWTAQDSNQQLLCSLIRLWIFEKQNPYLASYSCSGLIDSTDITGSTATAYTTFNWNTSTLLSSNNLYVNLTNLIEKYIYDFTKSGSYNISDDDITNFGSGTVDISCGASIVDEKWPDYVSFYLYVLIQYYIDNSSSSYIDNYSGYTGYATLDEYYIPALENDIAWIYDGQLNEIVTTSGDQVSATFNRLVFQLTELVEVYNNGDSTIGLSSADVKRYFDFEYYVKICAVLSNLLTSEISYNALTLSFTDSSLTFNYIDSGDNSAYTYTLGTAVISGYYRMISYLLMLENNIYPQYTRNTNTSSTIVPIQGTWPSIEYYPYVGSDSYAWQLDPNGTPSITIPGTGMTDGNIVAIITPFGYYEYDTNVIHGFTGYFLAGYFTLVDGGYSSELSDLQIILPSYANNAETTTDTVFNLYYCNSTCPPNGPTDISHLYSVTGTVTYLESMTLNQLIGNNSDYSFNLYGQADGWATVYTSTDESSFTSSWMNYFQGDQRHSVEDGSGNNWGVGVDSNTKSWCCNSGPYFAWHMGTLHMSNYRLNH